MRDIIKKLPKLRGHGVNRSKTVNSSVVKPVVINLNKLVTLFKSGDTISPIILVEKRIILRKSNKVPPVKILGTGDIDIKLSIIDCIVSKSVQDKIEAKGGSVTLRTK